MPKTSRAGSSGRKLPITRRALDAAGPSDVARVPASASSKRLGGNRLIRRYHTLQKDLSAARLSADAARASEIEGEIAALGGLDAYQQASIHGQDRRKGGDSSKVLVDWLKAGVLGDVGRPQRVLEIGSLSIDNYIARMPACELTRIDLNSQHPLIQKQDFLLRPAPSSAAEQFDGISCSLVLNFVAVAQRGDFLLQLTRFLAPSDGERRRWLFFVLPAPCVTNSRYMTLELLYAMFDDLGFSAVREKSTPRMLYLLLERTGPVRAGKAYKKRELLSGSSRNNFWIPLVT